MKKAAFLIPVAAAAASLATSVGATVTPIASTPAPNASRPVAGEGSIGTLLEYVRGDEQHLMLMQRDERGVVMAQHQSHSSHSSHSSHRSSAY
jgi:hypothetical protein